MKNPLRKRVVDREVSIDSVASLDRYNATIVCFAASGESDAMLVGKLLSLFAVIVWAG